jgi:NAD(P)-dependent dehydrogenase (short-subunit alcohol dehydrogenase family)
MCALVSGGASEIGSEILRSLVEQGASVVAVDSTEERIDEAVASLGLDDPDEVFTSALDTTDLVSWWDLANLIASYFHTLDLFVHVAEPAPAKPARELSVDEFRQAQATSAESFLMAMARLQKSLVEAGRESADGACVIAISPASANGSAPELPNAATRASVVAIVETMAREFSDESLNIRVNAIQPGRGESRDVARAVASAVIDLVSESGRSTNGQELRLDADDQVSS